MKRYLVAILLLGVPTVAWAPSDSMPKRLWQEARCTWYSLPKRFTASGERMNPTAMTAAHKTLPFGTIVEAVSMQTGRTVQVRITDRGPYSEDDPTRQFDLTPSAFQALGHSLKQGVADVYFRVVYKPTPKDNRS